MVSNANELKSGPILKPFPLTKFLLSHSHQLSLALYMCVSVSEKGKKIKHTVYGMSMYVCCWYGLLRNEYKYIAENKWFCFVTYDNWNGKNTSHTNHALFYSNEMFCIFLSIFILFFHFYPCYSISMHTITSHSASCFPFSDNI